MITPDAEVTDQEVDSLIEKYGDYEETSDSGPSVDADETTDPVEAAPVVEKQAKEPVIEQEPLHEFVHNGKTIKAPLSQIIKWSQQGYDYGNRVSELRKYQEQVKQVESKYKAIDEWVVNNPDKWDRLQAAITAEQQGYGELPADHPILQKFSKLEEFVNTIKSERDQAKIKQEDEALDTEIKSVQEKYKNLDWVTVDDQGRTREQRVLAHAEANGFKTFKSAFLDLYHEDLITAAETRAKEQLAATKPPAGLPQQSAKAPLQLKAPVKGKQYPTTQEILNELQELS